MNFNKVKEMVEEYFNKQYEVLKFLGEGSFAEVYLVKHKFLKDKRAMKIIKEPLKDDSNIDEIFYEVMIATELRHQNIISIYDAGLIGNIAYFVMEYVSGGDLEDYRNSYIKSDKTIPIQISLDIIKQILMGLNTLHSANPTIIHRDLKTSNILMNYSNEGEVIVKISDFGFAREVSSNKDDFEIGGTKPYMAPECFRKEFSTQSDVYAVGVIFYLLLSNEFPYDVKQFDIADIVEGKPWDIDLKPPSFFNENIPKFIDKIVLKSLDINPNERYDDAKDFENDLNSAIEKYKEYSYLKGYLDESEKSNKNNNLNDENQSDAEDFKDYIINDNILESFRLAKMEDRLDEAISILEKEVLKDYGIRKNYGKTLRLWKGDYPDAKLISEAFTVTLKGENYILAINLLKEAFAYNPDIKDMYGHFIDLWKIFIDLDKNKDNENALTEAVDSLEKLMNENDNIKNIYNDSFEVLKKCDKNTILEESINLADKGDLIEASKLLEFLVVYDNDIKDKYAYKLSLWKQDLSM